MLINSNYRRYELKLLWLNIDVWQRFLKLPRKIINLLVGCEYAKLIALSGACHNNNNKGKLMLVDNNIIEISNLSR